VVEIPGQDKLPSNLRVRLYSVVERHGWVWVWMGDAAAADEGLIPPVWGMDQPEYVFAHGQLDYAAEARWINENLLDLSHASFLHPDSFRTSETWARERPKVTANERSVVSERWFINEGAVGTKDVEPRVDTYFSYEFFVHGVLMQTIRIFPLGTGDALNRQQPDLNQKSADGFTTQAVTPLTDKTARYFYIMGSRRQGEETTYDKADMAVTEKAFVEEDKMIIEAQQRNIDVTPGWRFMLTTADREIVLFNRIVEKLIREESARSSQASQSVSPR